MSNLSRAKVRKLRQGQTYYRVWGWPVTDQHSKAWVSPCPRINGVHFTIFKSSVSMRGYANCTAKNRYFSSRKGAEKYLSEIFAGLHPTALYEVTGYSIRLNENMRFADESERKQRI